MWTTGIKEVSDTSILGGEKPRDVAILDTNGMGIYDILHFLKKIPTPYDGYLGTSTNNVSVGGIMDFNDIEDNPSVRGNFLHKGTICSFSIKTRTLQRVNPLYVWLKYSDMNSAYKHDLYLRGTSHPLHIPLFIYVGIHTTSCDPMLKACIYCMDRKPRCVANRTCYLK